MKSFKLPLLILFFLMLSCNNSTNSPGIGDSFTNITDDKFLGTWVFSNAVPESDLHDGSMVGATCKISKVEGTKESYSIDILSYQEVLFAKKDDSTLKAVDADMYIRFIESNQHIFYEIHPKHGLEFYKLK